MHRESARLTASCLARRIAAYAWAGPNTLAGLVVGALVVTLGGRVRVVAGNLEFCGGLLGRAVTSAHALCPFAAVTLGHVIVSATACDLDAVRAHEHVHVAQYERWGPLFLPAYVGSSLWQVVRRRRLYRDNFFERQAYARSDFDGRA